MTSVFITTRLKFQNLESISHKFYNFFGENTSPDLIICRFFLVIMTHLLKSLDIILHMDWNIVFLNSKPPTGPAETVSTQGDGCRTTTDRLHRTFIESCSLRSELVHAAAGLQHFCFPERPLALSHSHGVSNKQSLSLATSAQLKTTGIVPAAFVYWNLQVSMHPQPFPRFFFLFFLLLIFLCFVSCLLKPKPGCCLFIHVYLWRGCWG